MKKIILKYGLISAAITILFMVGTQMSINSTIDYDLAEVLGFLGMFITFSLILFAILEHRKKNLNGRISFGQSFKIGLLITIIASVAYAATWMVLTSINPEIEQNLWEMYALKMDKDQLSEDEKAVALEQLESYKEIYKNPLLKMGFTFLEIFMVGFPITILFAIIFYFIDKSKIKPTE